MLPWRAKPGKQFGTFGRRYSEAVVMCNHPPIFIHDHVKCFALPLKKGFQLRLWNSSLVTDVGPALLLCWIKPVGQATSQCSHVQWSGPARSCYLLQKHLVLPCFSGELAHTLSNCHVAVGDERCFYSEVVPRHLSSNYCSSLSLVQAKAPPNFMTVLVHGRCMSLQEEQSNINS